jgi:ATP-dependent Clp protease ATP-binding subunit ClpC
MMFERFTDRARQVVVLAEERARDLKHDSIRSEHLLLGMIREGQGLACRALVSLGISLDALRSRVENMAGTGTAESPDRLPLTPEAKRVLELAFREALGLGHSHIGTEHILVALTQAGGIATRAFQSLGVDEGKARRATAKQMKGRSLEAEGQGTSMTSESGVGTEVQAALLATTWRARRARELSEAIAKALGDPLIRDVDVFFGLLVDAKRFERLEGIARRLGVAQAPTGEDSPVAEEPEPEEKTGGEPTGNEGE